MALLSFAATLGCGAQDGSLPSDIDEATAGQTREAINDTAVDRPPAAAGIGVMVNGGRQLWVFACGDPSRNVLQVKKLNPVPGTSPQTWGGEWSDILPNAADAGCAGTPAVSAWPNSPNDEVEVLYRGLNNEVREFYIDANGNTSTLNLSQYLGIGRINGDPVIVDMGAGRIAVVVRLADNKLTSLDVYSGTWHKRPVLNAAGAQVFARSIVVGSFDAQSYGYFSAQVSSTQHLIFSRRAWDQSFRQLKGPIDSPAGLLTFGHLFRQSSCRPPNTCVIRRDGFPPIGAYFATTSGTSWSWNQVSANYISETTFWPDGGMTSYAGAGSPDSSYLLSVVSTGLQTGPVSEGMLLVYQRIPTFSSAPFPVVNPGDAYAGWAVINLEGDLQLFQGHDAINGRVDSLGLTLSTL